MSTWTTQVESKLSGKADETITTLLIIVGISLIAVALYSRSRIIKAGTLAWVLAP